VDDQYRGRLTLTDVVQTVARLADEGSEPRPVQPYAQVPLAIEEWDPATVDVAQRIAELVRERRPDVVVDHIGSSAVPGLPGKNVIDLGLDVEQRDVLAITTLLRELGFEQTTGPRSFPVTRPLLIGSIEHAGRLYLIHAHVHPRGNRAFPNEHARDLAFRDALRNDADLRAEYAARKRAIRDAGVTSKYRYSLAKTDWIRGALERLGIADKPITPPATIGIVGGGQLGRMLAAAARELGYRIAILDPDETAPARVVADTFVRGGFGDLRAARAMAAEAHVVTVELEHVAYGVMDALDQEWPLHPGKWAVFVTQNRIEERRLVEAEGGRVAPWREVRTQAELTAAADELGLPLRLKAATGGYDGRGQVRLQSMAEFAGALGQLGRPNGEPALAERELAFDTELSIICSRGVDGRTATFPIARNRHDEGILVESVSPAGVSPGVEQGAQQLVARLAEALDIVGTLTVELFLMTDGSLVVNELAPRVHNTGHWSIEGIATSQFEQHIRAICGLPFGSLEPRAGGMATVNLLGVGAEREARPIGAEDALRLPDVHVHLYDKRRVFERRKMGHVTALAASPAEALARAREAAALIGWA
jgi:5-(carboxyamino)imidazole ribonucleotide synthase